MEEEKEDGYKDIVMREYVQEYVEFKRTFHCSKAKATFARVFTELSGRYKMTYVDHSKGQVYIYLAYGPDDKAIEIKIGEDFKWMQVSAVPDAEERMLEIVKLLKDIYREFSKSDN